jgi:hypothetical protein
MNPDNAGLLREILEEYDFGSIPAEHTYASVYSTTLKKMLCSQEASMGHE